MKIPMVSPGLARIQARPSREFEMDFTRSVLKYDFDLFMLHANSYKCKVVEEKTGSAGIRGPF